MAQRFQQRVYEFEEFRLDAMHRMLYQNGKGVRWSNYSAQKTLCKMRA